jgi:hypothetical protein
MLTHGFSATFYTLYGSVDQTVMRQFTLKTVSFFTGLVRLNVVATPVVFTLGNNDSYEGNYKIEPNSVFLADTADLFYTDLLAGAADYASRTGSGSIGEPDIRQCPGFQDLYRFKWIVTSRLHVYQP